MWIQIAINAFSLGSFYVLIALGFALIFGVTHTFNLAHGELIVLSGYIAYSLGQTFHLSFWLLLPTCMIALLFCSILLNRLLHYVKEPFEINSLVVTFGVALVLQNMMLFFFSADYRLIAALGPPIRVAALGLSVTPTQLCLVGLSLMSILLLYLLFYKTFLGKALRATIQQREAARLAGIKVERMSLIAFMLGGLFIGMAGPLFGQVAYLHPAGGTEATLIAIIITIFAGVGRIRGILIGGWLLGFLESLAVFLLGNSWRELVSAVLLIALLILWPKGIPIHERK